MQFNSLWGEARTLRTRFYKSQDRRDIDDAISFYRQALALHPPSHPKRDASLEWLGYALYTRFWRYGDFNDVQEVIALQRQVLKLRPMSHPRHSESLSKLGQSLATCFERYGKVEDLEEAVRLHREVLKQYPPDHPCRSTSLNDFANSIQTRFQHLGKLEDLEETTVLHREALELCPLGHPYRSTSLINLANSVRIRFQQLGKLEDVEEAILLQREALELCPPGHPYRSISLTNLAISVRIVFEQLSKPEDLEEATILDREALELCPPGHPDRSISLNNLAISVTTRFEQLGKLEDLEEAIVLLKEALELCPPGHPYRSTSLNNLANSVGIRFQQLGKLEDLEEATDFQRKALRLYPPDHPGHSNSLKLLANIFLAKFDHLGGHDNLDQAMSLYAKATHNTLQPYSLRCFKFARDWAFIARKYQHASVIIAYDTALGSLPQLAALSLDIKARHSALPSGSNVLAREASQYAIENGKLEKAVEYLEVGRGVFWSQILQLRSPVDKLRDVAPRLADAFIRVSTELDEASHHISEVENPSNSQKIAIERERSRLQCLDVERSNTLDAIRGFPGFKDFLLPQRLATLQRAANTSPIVFLVANNKGSDCIVMTSADVQHIQLPNLPTKTLQILVRLLSRTSTGNRVWRSFEEGFNDIPETPSPVLDNLMCNASIHDSEPNPDQGKEGPLELGTHRSGYGKISSDAAFKEILGVLWDEIVKPVIEVLHLPVCDSTPRADRRQISYLLI